jgi:hypothetical protein
MHNKIYHWTAKDKWRYGLSMIPVVVMILGTSYVLYTFSIYMLILWLLIYLVINLFQAACCIGCPYRGIYCPAFFGVYLGNKISNFLYREERFDPKQFKRNALGGEISLAVFLLYPLHWLFVYNWYFVLIYVALVVLHVIIFLPTQCKYCSYNETCPGGRSYTWMCRIIRKK